MPLLRFTALGVDRESLAMSVDARNRVNNLFRKGEGNHFGLQKQQLKNGI
jgi:hypothetical protein